jgi:2-oxoisovalerate dehydrogenase E1 component alpha subunit
MSEAMNLAAVESAQVLFICQNNGWAISKPSHEQMLSSIADRANGFGIRSWSIAADDDPTTPTSAAWRGDAMSKRRYAWSAAR